MKLRQSLVVWSAVHLCFVVRIFIKIGSRPHYTHGGRTFWRKARIIQLWKYHKVDQMITVPLGPVSIQVCMHSPIDPVFPWPACIPLKIRHFSAAADASGGLRHMNSRWHRNDLEEPFRVGSVPKATRAVNRYEQLVPPSAMDVCNTYIGRKAQVFATLRICL